MTHLIITDNMDLLEQKLEEFVPWGLMYVMCSVLYCIVLLCISLYCTWCTLLYCTILYCTDIENSLPYIIMYTMNVVSDEL